MIILDDSQSTFAPPLLNLRLLALCASLGLNYFTCCSDQMSHRKHLQEGFSVGSQFIMVEYDQLGHRQKDMRNERTLTLGSFSPSGSCRKP